jgi:hypothetical protein
MQSKLETWGNTKYERSYKKAIKDIANNKFVSPLKAIRLACAEYVGFQEQEIRYCPAKDCILYGYRFGRNPHKRKLSEKQLKNISKLARRK